MREYENIMLKAIQMIKLVSIKIEKFYIKNCEYEIK